MAKPKMTREQFIAKYALGPGGTFLADDKGGNAASEVAGQNVGKYYDTYLGPNAQTTTQSGYDGDPTPIIWGQGRMPDGTIKTLDAWSNVDPHPESTAKSGWDTFLDIARPAAGLAALYFGGQYLLGDGALGAGATAAEGVGEGTGLASAAGYNPAMDSLAASNAMAPSSSLGLSGAAGLPSGAAPGASSFGFPTELGGGMASGVPEWDAAAKGAGMTLGGSGGGLLDTVKQWVGDNPTMMKLAGAALGAAASGDTKTSATSSKDPWAPAQPYLLQNLAQNQAMSNHYNANPFSQEQQNAYQGLLNTVANSQAAGNGLLSMAQNFGRSNHGVMPQFGPLGSAQAPAINWSQYQNIGRN